MRSSLRHLLVLALALTAGLGLAACGGGEETEESAGGDGQTAETPTGGTAVVNYTSFPDYLDPALSYTQEGWNSLTTAYNGLLSFRRAEGAEGAEVVPALAAELPEVSDDGKTYTFQLRDGLQYSDGTEVKASDFEHSIKRVLNLKSGGSAFYFTIEGAEEYFERGRANGDISGIEANDETGEITIRLTESVGYFPFVLSMPFASVVPGDTEFENLTTNPPPGVGAFKFEDVEQGRGYTLVRNENFPDIEGIPAPKLDSVRIDIVKNERRQAQDIIRNEVDWSVDPPPADQLRTIKAEYPDRYEEYVTNSTYYYFMNHDVAPFDDVRVRQAVNYAIDKRALARLFGGLLEPGCNFLPPGMAGYEKIEPCPYGDPTAEPQIERARELIREAGAEGAEVTVWGNDDDPSRPVTEYLTDVLNQIGLDAEPQIVEASAYFQTIGNQRTNAQIGYANWFQDFPHPQNFMFLVDPDTIQDTNNQNFGNVDDEEIGRILDEANQLPIEESADMYAQVDRMLLEDAHVAPYGHLKLANFVSERVDFENCTVTHPVFQLDLTQFCVTGGE
jgi:peptide/nickel transport system substrate-binding protein